MRKYTTKNDHAVNSLENAHNIQTIALLWEQRFKPFFMSSKSDFCSPTVITVLYAWYIELRYNVTRLHIKFQINDEAQ